MEFTMWDWIVEVWRGGWQIWMLGVISLAVVTIIRTSEHVAKRRKQQSQISRKIQIVVRYEEAPDTDYQLEVGTRQSLVSLQPIH
jgi:hypothetical protein